MIAARTRLRHWITIERRYADRKYAEDTTQRDRLRKAMREEGYGQEWGNFVDLYLKRAEQAGLHTLEGRRLMGKAITTLMHCLETAIEELGDMPRPGVSSTEDAVPWGV